LSEKALFVDQSSAIGDDFILTASLSKFFLSIDIDENER